MIKTKSKVTLESLLAAVNNYRAEVVSFKVDTDEKFEELASKISHLPTKEEYYKREDITMGKLKSIEEQLETTKNLYEMTNKRIDIHDKKLKINTSVVF